MSTKATPIPRPFPGEEFRHYCLRIHALGLDPRILDAWRRWDAYQGLRAIVRLVVDNTHASEGVS